MPGVDHRVAAGVLVGGGLLLLGVFLWQAQIAAGSGGFDVGRFLIFATLPLAAIAVGIGVWQRRELARLLARMIAVTAGAVAIGSLIVMVILASAFPDTTAVAAPVFLAIIAAGLVVAMVVWRGTRADAWGTEDGIHG